MNKVILGVFLLAIMGVMALSIYNQNSDILATVNGEEITSQEVLDFQQEYALQGQQVSEQEAVDQLINKEVLSQKATQEGFFMEEAEFMKAMEEQLALQGSTLEDYKQQLVSQGISFEERSLEIKEQLAINSYIDSKIDPSKIVVTESEVMEFYESLDKENLPPFEDIKEQIFKSIQQQKLLEEINSLLTDLKEDSQIRY